MAETTLSEKELQMLLVFKKSFDLTFYNEDSIDGLYTV